MEGRELNPFPVYTATQATNSLFCEMLLRFNLIYLEVYCTKYANKNAYMPYVWSAVFLQLLGNFVNVLVNSEY